MKRNRDPDPEEDNQPKRHAHSLDSIPLPSNVLSIIFDKLSSFTLFRCSEVSIFWTSLTSKVSKQWKELSEIDELWQNRALNIFISRRYEPEVWWKKKQATSSALAREANKVERRKRKEYHDQLGYNWKHLYGKIGQRSCAVCGIPASFSSENNAFLCDEHNPEVTFPETCFH